MPRKAKNSVRTQRKTGLTPAEVLYGESWVERQWKAAKGILKGKGPKNPVVWQRKIRREWE